MVRSDFLHPAQGVAWPLRLAFCYRSAVSGAEQSSSSPSAVVLPPEYPDVAVVYQLQPVCSPVQSGGSGGWGMGGAGSHGPAG